ncbi:hypothetical protein Tco_0163708 [Tanacetum coccineum]
MILALKGYPDLEELDLKQRYHKCTKEDENGCNAMISTAERDEQPVHMEEPVQELDVQEPVQEADVQNLFEKRFKTDKTSTEILLNKWKKQFS